MEVWLDPQFRECDVVPNNWHGIHTVKGGYLYGRNIDKGIGIVSRHQCGNVRSQS